MKTLPTKSTYDQKMDCIGFVMYQNTSPVDNPPPYQAWPTYNSQPDMIPMQPIQNHGTNLSPMGTFPTAPPNSYMPTHIPQSSAAKTPIVAPPPMPQSSKQPYFHNSHNYPGPITRNNMLYKDRSSWIMVYLKRVNCPYCHVVAPVKRVIKYDWRCVCILPDKRHLHILTSNVPAGSVPRCGEAGSSAAS